MSSETPKDHVYGPKVGDLRLSNANLDTLPANVGRPAYDRSRVTPGIVHLGIGAFHRAHQAVVIDDLLAGDVLVRISHRSASPVRRGPASA